MKLDDPLSQPVEVDNKWIGEKMMEVHKVLEEEQEKNNVIEFPSWPDPALIGPVTQPKGPEENNWLSALEEKTTFLVARQAEDFVVEAAEAFVVRQTPACTLLQFHMPTHSFLMWVVHKNYSKLYKCIEVIRTAEEQEEKDHGTDNYN